MISFFFQQVQREFHLPAGDFPNVDRFREVLSGYSIDKFEKLKPKMIQAVDDMLGYDIPELLKNFRNPYEWECVGSYMWFFCCKMLHLKTSSQTVGTLKCNDGTDCATSLFLPFWNNFSKFISEYCTVQNWTGWKRYYLLFFFLGWGGGKNMYFVQFSNIRMKFEFLILPHENNAAGTKQTVSMHVWVFGITNLCSHCS